MGFISPKFTDLKSGIYLKTDVYCSSQVPQGRRLLYSGWFTPSRMGGWITLWMLLPQAADNGRKQRMVSSHVPLRNGCCGGGMSVGHTFLSPLSLLMACRLDGGWGRLVLAAMLISMLHLPQYGQVKSQHFVASDLQNQQQPPQSWRWACGHCPASLIGHWWRNGKFCGSCVVRESSRAGLKKIHSLKTHCDLGPSSRCWHLRRKDKTTQKSKSRNKNSISQNLFQKRCLTFLKLYLISLRLISQQYHQFRVSEPTVRWRWTRGQGAVLLGSTQVGSMTCRYQQV